MARSNDGRLALALLISATLHGLLLMQHVAEINGLRMAGRLNVRLLAAVSPQTTEQVPPVLESATPEEIKTPDEALSRVSERQQQPAIGAQETGIVPRQYSESLFFYFPAAELHQRPVPLRRIDLSFLQEKFPGQQAELTLRINETGTVDNLRVETNTPELEQAIRDFVANLSFVPGKIANRAVKSEIRIELRLAGG